MSFRSKLLKATIALGSAAAIGGLAIAPAGATTPSKAPTGPAPLARPVAQGTSALAPAGPFSRFAPQDGNCEVGEVCLYYFSNFVGSRYDTPHNDSTLFDNHFVSAGAGQGAVVGADAESVWNRDPHTTVWVCTGTNQTGSCGYVLPNQFGNFNSTFFNNVGSLIWADSTN